MNYFALGVSLNTIAKIDPGPFFVLSLIPYLFFLFFAQKSNEIPKISLWGFRLTLVFVFVTILLAIFSQIYFSDELTNIDPLHGIAEAFLTLSDALVAYGFLRMLKLKQVKNS